MMRSSYEGRATSLQPGQAAGGARLHHDPQGASLMDRTPVRATVEYDRPGKHHGHLCVPYS